MINAIVLGVLLLPARMASAAGFEAIKKSFHKALADCSDMKAIFRLLLLILLINPNHALAAEDVPKEDGFEPAQQILAKVGARMAEAKAKGIDVLYWQAAAIPMRVGLNERWQSFPAERSATLEYVEKRGPEIIQEIDSVLAGASKPRPVSPKPDFTRMKLKGRNFYEGDVPAFIYSVHSGPVAETEPFFDPHTKWVYTCMAPGADRFNYKQMPIWEAFNQYPDTRRIYDGGWCGHIIADKWSGGVNGADCVICLESPHTRQACVEAYRKILPAQMQSKTRQISLLDYEYYYICYCERSRDLFRSWLEEKFGHIDKLNEAWGTTHPSFTEIQLSDYRRREHNDAKRYDWLDFNLWRFTQFMKWAKVQQRQIDPDIPMATCAPHYNFTKEWGESGSDVEALTAEVNDFCLNESPPSTKYVDFLRSLSDNRKAIVEIEGSEYRNTMAGFLHGLSALSLYWAWDNKPGDGGAMLYGRGNRPPYCTLPEVERFLRTGLDLRRLRREILAIQQDIKAPVALLYSRASLLQVPQISGDKTPYLMELDRTYDALLESGVPVDFITTQQVLAGKLAPYRVLVIPAATYEHAAVVKKVMDFARNGGQVVLVPNSWFFDQYNRKQDYLVPLNLQVTSMKAPKILAGQAKTGLERDASGEETEAPFLMGLIVDTVVTNVPKANITMISDDVLRKGKELQGAGVRHVLKVGSDNRVLGTFSDDQPAIVQVPVDQGHFYYLAMPLLAESMAELMDGILDHCGVQRPIRFLTPDGKHVSGLEYRAIQSGDGWLAYVNNLNRQQDQPVKLVTRLVLNGIRNLTLERDLSPSFTVPAGETYILRLAQSNLAYNGDFELESNQNPPAGWAMWGAQQSKIPDHFTRDTSQRHEGKASFRIYHPRQSQGYIVTAPERAIRPKEGVTYTVSFWARADAPVRTSFGLTAYESIQPFRDAPTPGFWPIQLTAEWQRFSFEVQEGLEFFAAHSRYLLLTFHATTDPAEERILWVDDVFVTERSNPEGVRLMDEDLLAVPPLTHRLRPGERFELTLDTQRVARPVTRDLAGISFHRVAGWTGLPYNRQGQYVLAPELEEAIRDLHLPMTRFYAVGHEAFPVEESIDKAAEFCRRIGVPLDHVVLELEDQSANLKLEAIDWSRAVRHSLSKGYAFRHWEVGNEVYSQTFSSKSPMGQAFDKPDDYVAHVKAVSAAVKTAQPDAQIGLSINLGNLKWGSYVLKQAAGSYDFVCPHLYAVWQNQGRKFETVALTENFKVLERAERLKALIHAYNQSRDVYVYDTEWGMHSAGPKGERADDVYRNGNLWGAMHRAVRMIYYLREGTLRGASSWEMFSRVKSPGFGFISKDTPEQRFLLYWLYYYLNRHLGDSVLEIDGTAPYYTLAAGDDRFFNAGELPGPLTPTLATLSADKKSVYVVIANASWDKAIPCRIDLHNFEAKSANAIALSQRDPEGHPLVERKEEAISQLPVTFTGQRANLMLPARSVVFLDLRNLP
jgi:hypothetical protein